MLTAFLFEGGGCLLAKRSAESHSPTRKAQRRRAGTSGTVPVSCRMALHLSGLRHPPVSPYTSGLASATPPGRASPAPYPPLCRMALRLSGLRYPHVSSYIVGPASAAPPGDDRGHGAAFMPGGGSRLARPTGASRRLIRLRRTTNARRLISRLLLGLGLLAAVQRQRNRQRLGQT